MCSPVHKSLSSSMNASILKGHRRGASLVLNNPAKETTSSGSGPFHLHKSPSSNDGFRLPVINSAYGSQNCVSSCKYSIFFPAQHKDTTNCMIVAVHAQYPLYCHLCHWNAQRNPITTLGENKLIDSAMPNQILNTAHGHA